MPSNQAISLVSRLLKGWEGWWLCLRLTGLGSDRSEVLAIGIWLARWIVVSLPDVLPGSKVA